MKRRRGEDLRKRCSGRRHKLCKRGREACKGDSSGSHSIGRNLARIGCIHGRHHMLHSALHCRLRASSLCRVGGRRRSTDPRNIHRVSLWIENV